MRRTDRAPGRPTPADVPLQVDVRRSGRGRATTTCDHPALVVQQVPRHVDPEGDWRDVPGVHVLTGTELHRTTTRTGPERTSTMTTTVRPWAHVGLSEKVFDRMTSHRQSKEEWRRALLVRSGATPSSSDDITYLEARVHAVLAETQEVTPAQAVPHGNASAQPRLTGTLI